MTQVTQKDIQLLSGDIKSLARSVDRNREEHSHQIGSVKVQVGNIDKKLFRGNGEPGLVTQVQLLQKQSDERAEQERLDRVSSSKIKTAVIIAVTGGAVTLLFTAVKFFWF